jgi:isopentenyl diphosphate isomerase/L-lactate dehydrogenase-like FMN-dependent dehydrogenase
MEPLNLRDYEAAAERIIEPAAFAYFVGGAEDERTLRANVEGWSRWQLRPRVLVDVGTVSTATTVLGTPVSLPVLVGPVALQRLAHPDGEIGMARAAAAAGTVMCLSTTATAGLAEVAAASPHAPRWFQLYAYRDRGVTLGLLQEARDAGYTAVVLTVDAPVPAKRERDLRSGFRIPATVRVRSHDAAVADPTSASLQKLFALVDPALTWPDVADVAAASGLPVVVKGVMTAEDGRLACEHGAAAVVVSNHGGRQLDGVAPTCDLLPEVAEAIDGRIEVLVDGGIRRGTDVVRALALGARAVLLGRPTLWGLAVGGEDGAFRVLDLLRAEIANTLALLGCPTLRDVTPDHVRRAL